MKKLLLALTLILCLSLSVVAFTSCGGNGEGEGDGEACEHVWATMATTDKAATCTEDGSASVKCIECGSKKADSVTVIAATGHDYQIDSVVAATCVEAGSETKICANCGDTATTDIPATGNHEWADFATVDKAPTCTEAGEESIKCNVCQTKKDDSVTTIDASHTWSPVVTIDPDNRPTCTESGTKSVKCLFCQAKKDGTEEVVPATGHSELTVVTVPTMFSDGYASGICSDCGQPAEVTLPKTDPVVYSSIANRGELKEMWSMSDILDDGEKHFYPTEDDPDGNALYVEYSILWNPTLHGIKNGYGYMTSPRIEGNNNNDYDAAYWFNLINNEKTSDCDKYGVFEVIKNNGVVYGPTFDKNGNYLEEYPNIGDYGWHRIGIEMKQTAEKVGDSMKKKMIVTLYLDGEMVSCYEMGIRYEHNWFFSAEFINGEIEYEDIALSADVLPYYIPYLTTESGSDPAYFVVADVYVTAGDGFVMNVTPVDDPADATYTVEEGVDLPGKVFFSVVSNG